MLVSKSMKRQYKNKGLSIFMLTGIIFASIFMINLFLDGFDTVEKTIDFKVYQVQYNNPKQEIIVWLDHNGTKPCKNLQVMIHPNHKWVFETVQPEQFIRLNYPKQLDTSKDIQFYQEVFIEWVYLENGEEKNDDKILWIIIEKENIIL